MKLLVKPAIVLGIAGTLALGSMTASQARVRPWVAGAAGFAAGAAIGAAAANANGYYNGGYYDGGYSDSAYYDGGYYGDGYAYSGPAYGSYAYDRPGTSYTGDPAYSGYGDYAYAPGYRSYGYNSGYDASTRSTPRHYDPDYGYNSNTLAPWQDRKMQGNDY